MRITKFGHSCLLIEEKTARILIDPGYYSTGQNQLNDLDVVIITHEHQDHCDITSVKTIVANNPAAVIYTNPSIERILAGEGITSHVLGDKERVTVKGVDVEGVGINHAFIYPSLPVVRNVGVFIANRLFYPGDALNVPDRHVDILAYPAVAPWMNIAEAIDYGKAVKPTMAFPVHDGFLISNNPYIKHAEREFTAIGTRWLVINTGESVEV